MRRDELCRCGMSIIHPVGAFTAEDKKTLANRVTERYANIPIPRFYVVFIFEEVAQDSCLSGLGDNHERPTEDSHRDRSVAGIGAGIMQVLLELRAPFGSLRYLERLGSLFGCANARRVPITGQEAVLV